MGKLLTPKNDVVFKMLFAEDREILTDLINSSLQLTEDDRIVSVTVRNPVLLPDEIGSKYIVMDIRAEDEIGGEYNIEMQVRRFSNYPQRTLFYLCRIYNEQLKAGENYSRLNPVIGIHFLDYELFPEHDDFHYRFYLKDIRYPDLDFTNDISFHIFEMTNAEKYLGIDGKTDDSLMEWLDFFNSAGKGKEDVMQKQYSNPMINRAVDRLKILSSDITVRELAERREKALRDEAMFLEEATRKGIEKGKIKEKKATAAKLLQMKLLTVDQIAETVGMDVKEILEIDREVSSITEMDNN